MKCMRDPISFIFRYTVYEKPDIFRMGNSISFAFALVLQYNYIINNIVLFPAQHVIILGYAIREN